MKLTQQRRGGFTLIEIMIVVAIIGMLAAFAIPNYVHARTNAQQNACMNNLRQIDGAKQQWALENKVSITQVPDLTDIQPYLGRGAVGTAPVCPGDTGNSFSSSYEINDVQTAPACKINVTNHFLN